MWDWDFSGQITRTLKISGFLLVFFCLFLVFQQRNPVLWGFVLGTAVGMWNAFFLTKRMRKIVDMPVEMAKANVMGGCVMRLFTTFTVLFFVAWTGWISPFATVAGLFVVPCIFTVGVVGMLIREAREVKSHKIKN